MKIKLILCLIVLVRFVSIAKGADLTDPIDLNEYDYYYSDLWNGLETSDENELDDDNIDYEPRVMSFLDMKGNIHNDQHTDPSNFSQFSEVINLNKLCNGLLFNAIPHPNDNNLFIGCIEEKGTIFGCDEENLVFDPKTVKCVDPKLTATPTESPTTSTAEGPSTKSSISSTTPQSTTTTKSGTINISFSCPSSGVGFIPHKTDCTRYYECIRGIANPKTCATAGYHYDVASKQCKPADVAICANTIRCV